MATVHAQGAQRRLVGREVASVCHDCEPCSNISFSPVWQPLDDKIVQTHIAGRLEPLSVSCLSQKLNVRSIWRIP